MTDKKSKIEQLFPSPINKESIVKYRPRGNLTKKIHTNLAEILRSVGNPEEIGFALLEMFRGRDPYQKERTDGMPVVVKELSESTRIAALKLYMEYAYGKPLQGVVVQAQVQHQNNMQESDTVQNLRELAARDPETRAAMMAIARKMAPPLVEPETSEAENMVIRGVVKDLDDE